MAGRVIVVQRRIALDYSDLAGNASYEHTHLAMLEVPGARELVLSARVLSRNMGGRNMLTRVYGVYFDPCDAGDIKSAAPLLSLDVGTTPSTLPGVTSATLSSTIPGRIRVVTLFQQNASPGKMQITFSLEMVVRD